MNKSTQSSGRFDKSKNLNTPYFRRSIFFSTGILLSKEETKIDNILKIRGINYISKNQVKMELNKKGRESLKKNKKSQINKLVLDLKNSPMYKKRSLILVQRG